MMRPDLDLRTHLPPLVIRSQVLSMKERQFVSVAKLSGVGDMGIIFGEIMPNLLPFIAAAFVGAVFAAVFVSFYLAVLGCFQRNGLS